MSFMAALDSGIDLITKAPHIWPIFEAGTRRYLLKNFPYSLIYRRQVTGVTESPLESRPLKLSVAEV